MGAHSFSGRRRQLLGGAALALPAGMAQAATATAAALSADDAASDTTLAAHALRTGLYRLSGGGGNSLLRLSGAGLVLVNAKATGQQRALRTAIARLNRQADLPLRALVLTDASDAHAGNARGLQRAGVALLAQRQLAGQLAPPDGAWTASPGPEVLFDDRYTLQIGGVELRLLHVGPARTRADTVVHFPDLRVVAVGHLLVAGEPEIDPAQGGSLAGWRSALQQVLALAPELVVPASGPPLGPDAVQALVRRIDARMGTSG